MATAEEIGAAVTGAASLEDAIERLKDAVGAATVDPDIVQKVAAAWHLRPVAAAVGAGSPMPRLNGFTTFEFPRIIDTYVSRVLEEATPYASYTHADGAEIYCRWNKNYVLYCKQIGRWLVWSGKVWIDGADDLVRDSVDHFLGIYGQAALRDGALGKSAQKVQAVLHGAAFRNGMMDILKDKQELAINVNELDANDWDLNTTAGIVDLKTGALRAHDPTAHCTKITAVGPMPLEEFEAAWEGSRFWKFLREIFAKVPAEDFSELIAFEQQSCGYCITGDSKIHILKFWYGEGRNGKSTLGEMQAFVSGSYAKKISNTVLMSTKGDRHPTEIANFLAVRTAYASEIAEGSYINESLVKELTGDAELSARFMRKDFFTFRRTHKHIIYGNTKPRLRVADAAIKSRLKLTAFGVNFEAEGKLDPTLKVKLLEEAPLILTWLINGARFVWEAGLVLPRSAFVARETEDYVTDNDVIQVWLDERCVSVAASAEGKLIATRSSELYKDYRDWKIARGEHCEAIQRWIQLMISRGWKRSTRDGIGVFLGVGLRTDREQF